MEAKLEFVTKAMNHPNFREVCREYGISAKTGYKWVERFKEHGIGGLGNVSRRPHGHAEQLSEEVVCQIVKLKGAHMHWGPRKIRVLYQRLGIEKVPSESSFKRVLEHSGLTVPRRIGRREDTGRLNQGLKAKAPNEVWTVDFKGWWKDSKGLRVEPLTVRDEYSRMILGMRLMENGKTEGVMACFVELFKEYGLPAAIRSDNGPPFASYQGLLGLTRLSAWWLAQGIDLERSRPGCPQDNGGHERMHRDIRCELEAGRVGRDQKAFDVWREEHNTERPHEALAMKVPTEIYTRSQRLYKGSVEDIDYGQMARRKVKRKTGDISYENHSIGISATLGGWSVGLSPRQDGKVQVWFAKLMIGILDPQTASFKAASGLKAGAPEPSQCNP